MKHNICFAVIALLFSVVVSAQTSTTVLNQKISAKVSGVNKSYQIQASQEPANQFEIIIQNGDGLNYFPQICSGSFVQKILCKVQNLVKAVYVELDRPDQLELKLNNELVANRSNFPQQQGQLTLTRTLTGLQNLTVFVKGLPTSDVTIKVKKFANTNQLPIARFDFSALSDVEPSVVSFSALLSSDSDGSIASYSWNFGDSSSGSGAVVSHTYNTAGTYDVSLTVTDDRGGQHTLTKPVIIRADTFGPLLSHILPANNSNINGTALTISGNSDEALSKVEIKVNSEALQLANIDPNQKHFSLPLNFTSRGIKNILITAYDLKNNQSQVTQQYTVSFNNEPTAKIIILSQSNETVPSMIWFDASTSTDPDGDQLTYHWDFSDIETSSEEKPTHLFKQAGNYTVTLTVSDGFGGSSEVTRVIALQNPVLPPDPATQAPPLSENTPIPQSNTEKFEFLYQGADPIQKNVDVTKIVDDRLTPIRGKILKDSDTPVEGVKVSVKDHPEYGYTLTRNDGMWDLAINGGGTVIVEFSKGGYLTSQRQVDTENFIPRNVEDVILTEIDEKKTVVALNSAIPQIHEATVVQDSDGVRKAQVLIPANTTAEIVMPDGTRHAVEQLTIRATEFTVGEEGPKRMPANLPPRTAYTYAADFTADEAIALGGGQVEFSQPVPIYVDNFLNIPVGYAVPAGYLNPKSGYWEQMPDAVVLKVLNINNQKAELDFKGQGQVITAEEKTILGITDSELEIIAQKYQAGQSFWRARSNHFSIIDLNMGLESTDINPLPNPDEENCDECLSEQGCIINVQRQLLEEQIKLKGLGNYVLHYSTERVSGREVSNMIDFSPFTEYTLNASYLPLISATITVEVAGKTHVQNFNNPQLTDKFTYAWDGMDAFGRKVAESQEAKITVEYFYPLRYIALPYDPAVGTFDTANPSTQAVLVPGRQQFKLLHKINRKISSPLDRFRIKATQQFNGWSLANYHSYDPIQKTLYKGSGETIKSNTITSIVTTVAGTGANALAGGDEGPATLATFISPTVLALDLNRNLYISDGPSHRVRRISDDGIITTVIGTGIAGYDGDGGYADEAKINGPNGLAIAEDGTIYFSDQNNNVVRKRRPDGRIFTVAGTGVAGFSGDGGPALQAKLNFPRALVLGTDGSLYISDSNNNRIRRVWTDGKITTYAGTGVPGFSGDGGPAIQAQFRGPNFTFMDKQNNLYIAEFGNRRIRKISANGIITTIAGNGILNGPSPDNELATEVSLGGPIAVAVSKSGEVYFSDESSSRIRKIDNKGIITTVIGTGVSGFNGNGLSGLQTQVMTPRWIIFDENESLIFADAQAKRIRKLSNGLLDDFPAKIPSTSGDEIYFFNDDGLHEKTTYADTGATKYEFIHDNNGLLQYVKDAYQSTLTINRDSNGNLTSMQGPYGQIYQFETDANEYISKVIDPLSNTYNITYNSKGLMTSFQKPEGGISTYNFDGLGRLIRVDEPNGGFKILARSPTGEVTMTNSLGFTSKYQNLSEAGVDGSVFKHTASDLSQMTKTDKPQEGITKFTTSQGTSTEVVTFTDQRFPGFVTYQASSNTTYSDLNNAGIATFNSRTYTFNPDGINFVRNTVQGDSSGFSVSSSFNSTAKTITSSTTTGATANSTFDNQLKTTSLKIGNLVTANMIYDGQGRLSQVTQGNRTTNIFYNSQGFVREIIDAENRSTKFITDDLGRVTRTILPDNEETLLQYDKNSNITGITPPQRLMHQFVNNIVDLVSSYTAPGGLGSKSYQYDSDEKLTKLKTENNSELNISYGQTNGWADAEKVTTIASSSLWSNFQYDNDHQLLHQANSSDQINITYDRAADILKSKTYSGRFPATVSYAYKPNGLLPESESINSNDLEQVYNADKQLTRKGPMVIVRQPTTGLPIRKIMGAFEELITYNGFGEISSRDVKLNANSIYKEVYTRDKLGRITVKDVIQNSITTSWGYTYDLRGRLRTISQNGVLQKTYFYDANGNRVNINDGSNQNIYSAGYDAQDRIQYVVKNNQTTAFGYSNDGFYIQKQNQITNVMHKYNVDLQNPLVKVDIIDPINGDKSVTYWTDAELKRSAKLVDGVVKSYYIYDMYKRLIAELRPDYSVKSRFVYLTQGHSPDYIINPSLEEVYYLVKDQLGSILKVVKEDGTILQELTYDEFGVVLSDTASGYQPFGYAGGHYDHDTGLVRFGARDYDASIGRWIEKDPIDFDGGDTNLYAYVNSDPVNGIDPSGLTNPVLVVGGVAFAYTAGYFVGTVAREYFQNNKSFSEALKIAKEKANFCDNLADAAFDEVLGPAAPALKPLTDPQLADTVNKIQDHNQANEEAGNEKQ